MPRKRHTPEQITAALRQSEAGTPVGEIIRKRGVHENARLKKLVADLKLDMTMLQDVLRKRW